MSVLDVKSLTNSELKEQLLKRGVRPGPILPTTRTVYEKKLLQMLDQRPLVPQVKQNGTGDVDRYSDSEEEGLRLDNGTAVKSEAVTAPANTTSNFSHSKTSCYPGAGYSQTPPPSDTYFSLTKMVEQGSIESSERFLTRLTIERLMENFNRKKIIWLQESAGEQPTESQSTKTSDSRKEDVLTEMLPPDTQPPLGLSATRRRPIKGAAGRPIQFKYDDIAAQAKLMEQVKVEVGKKAMPPRLLTVPLQIVLFAIVVFFILVFFTMESDSDNPFTSLIEKVEVHQAP